MGDLGTKFFALEQLTAMFGEEFAFLYGDEDTAFRTYASSNDDLMTVALVELDEVIAANLTDTMMREALRAHGTSIRLDGADAYLALAHRLRVRLLKAIAALEAAQPPHQGGSAA